MHRAAILLLAVIAWSAALPCWAQTGACLGTDGVAPGSATVGTDPTGSSRTADQWSRCAARWSLENASKWGRAAAWKAPAARAAAEPLCAALSLQGGGNILLQGGAGKILLNSTDPSCGGGTPQALLLQGGGNILLQGGVGKVLLQ